jgi:sulfur carrier protein
MNLVVNGKETNINDGLTVSQLLVEVNIKMPQMVSVELNGRILRKSEYDQTALKENDKVEFLYFMGGGNAVD